jgi:hypothetical protein
MARTVKLPTMHGWVLKSSQKLDSSDKGELKDGAILQTARSPEWHLQPSVMLAVSPDL